VTPVLMTIAMLAAAASAEQPFDLSSRTVLLTARAEGLQIYECKAANGGAATWTFREPIATLMSDDKTVGRHFAGPRWALDDGSGVQGKQAGSAPGETPADIPQLKLDIVAHSGHGMLDQATQVYRIRTHGGVLTGDCDQPGTHRGVPYMATYVFTK
jgi:hypothetical protein